MKQNESVSPPQTTGVLRALLEAMPEVLSSVIGREIVLVSYGYGSGLHPDLCYVPMKVGIDWLDRFIRESTEQRIVKPGESDIIFQVRGEELEVEVCHEAHVHVSGSNVALVGRLLEHPALVRLIPASGNSLGAA